MGFGGKELVKQRGLHVDYTWPSDKTQSESKKLIELFDSLPLDGEIQCDGAPKSSRASAYKQIEDQQTPTLSLKQGASAIDNSGQEDKHFNFSHDDDPFRHFEKHKEKFELFTIPAMSSRSILDGALHISCFEEGFVGPCG